MRPDDDAPGIPDWYVGVGHTAETPPPPPDVVASQTTSLDGDEPMVAALAILVPPIAVTRGWLQGRPRRWRPQGVGLGALVLEAVRRAEVARRSDDRLALGGHLGEDRVLGSDRRGVRGLAEPPARGHDLGRVVHGDPLIGVHRPDRHVRALVHLEARLRSEGGDDLDVECRFHLGVEVDAATAVDADPGDRVLLAHAVLEVREVRWQVVGQLEDRHGLALSVHAVGPNAS